MFLNDFEKLPHLIWFCLTFDILKVHEFRDIWSEENVMAAFSS